MPCAPDALGRPDVTRAPCQRRGRDSNPRMRKPPLRDFQSRSLSQLGHLSLRAEVLHRHAGTCRMARTPLYYALRQQEEESMSDERIEILRKVQLFDGLSDKELAAVANAAKERRFDTGDTVVGEGEGGVGFFVIADGTARVETRGERRATLSAGASFGEVALLDEGGRRTASVIAESPLRVFGLPA